MPSHLIIHGGGATAPEASRTFIARAGEPDAPILVLAQTAEDAPAKAAQSTSFLRENGARNVIAPDSIASVLKALETARGVWIPGGDQNRLMARVGTPAVLAAVRDVVLRRSATAGGSSAGASLMGECMPTSDGDRTVMTRGAVAFAPGLGLLNGVLVDSHFLKRERMQRLVNMVLSNPERIKIGIGIDENAWVETDAGCDTLTVRGDKQVVIVRSVATSATSATKIGRNGALGARNIRLSILLPGNTSAQYFIYGHSAGGQFVHRLVLTLPNARYARAVTANSGYYTLPALTGDAAADPFPFSLKNTPVSANDLAKALQRDVIILLGENDTDAQDPDLYHGPEADKQGLFRFARGKFFLATAQAEAKKRSTKLGWRIVTVPGVGHSNEKMAPAAARVLFAPNK